MKIANLIRIGLWAFGLLASFGASAQQPGLPPPRGLSVIPVPPGPAGRDSGGRASALNPADTVIIAARINPERAAKNLGTVLRECTGNSVCNGAIDAALGYFGVPSGSAKLVMDFIPNVTQGGEMTFYEMKLPAGYSFCHLKMDFYSTVPPTGDRSPFMDINMTAAFVKVKTWTPVRNASEGRSWIDALVTVQGVRNEVADQWYSAGKCKIARNEKLYCRGDFNKSQVNHGEPGCRSTNF